MGWGKFKEVTVVPVNDFSFKWAIENNLYAFPASTSRKINDYVAFYRTAPISAVTHLAEVKEVIEGGRLSGEYRKKAFGRRKNRKAIKVKLKNFEKLDPPVGTSGSQGMQNIRYTTLEKLGEAETVDDT